MSTRALALFAAAVVILLALVIFSQRSGSDATGNGTALVPNLAAALGDIERVTVVKANNETVATLEKRPESWVVVDKHGYAASAVRAWRSFVAFAT